MKKIYSGAMTVVTVLIMSLSIATGSDEVITADNPGTERISNLKDLFGETLVNADGDMVDIAELDGEKIGIYFSALWCPPCRAFTPSLVNAYNELKEQGKPFDLVFVSHDRSEDAMARYMQDYDMPWQALNFNDPRRENLTTKFGVRGLPTLVIVDADGDLLSSDGRSDVAEHGAAAFDMW